MKKLKLLLSGAFVLFLVSNAQSAILSYQFSGIIDEVQGNSHGGFFTTGIPVTGRYTFDTDSIDFNPNLSLIQSYSIGDPYGFEFTINDISFSTDTASMLFANDNAGEDRYSVNETQLPLLPSGYFEGLEGLIKLSGVLLLVDHSQTYFSGSEPFVPLTTPDISLFDYTKLRFWGTDGTVGPAEFYITANISYLARVLEPIVIDIKPERLNSHHGIMHHGEWITTYIELPEGYYVEDVDIDSVTLTKINDDLLDPPLYTVGSSAIGDYDDDGIPDLMVKFDRQELIPLLEVGDAELTVAGELIDGTIFEGTDTIRVIDKDRK